MPPAVFSPLIHLDCLMFSLIVHEEVYIKDAFQNRCKSAIGNQEFVRLNARHRDPFIPKYQHYPF